MSRAACPTAETALLPPVYSAAPPSPPVIPVELAELRAKIRAMPADVRAELEPLAEDACEQAKFRGRALSLAREALEQFRLELAAAQHDLDATRREREGFRRWVERGV